MKIEFLEQVYIYTYNIFKPGGTTRYVHNFIQLFKDKGIKVTVINYLNFKQSSKEFDVIYYKKFNYETINFKNSIIIISREDFFNEAVNIKRINKNIIIIGEIHASLNVLEEKNLFLEYIDVIKVNTELIRRQFIIKYNYNRVFKNYVPINHIQTNFNSLKRTNNQIINFYNVTRFSEDQKNIKYAFELIKKLKNTGLQVNFYLKGYGESEKYYHFLIKYYDIEDCVKFNQEIPKNGKNIFLSTSNYETFGYSILEGLANSSLVATTFSKDRAIKEVYKNLNNIIELTYDLEKDINVLKKKIYQDVKKENVINDLDTISKRINSKLFLENYFEQVYDLLEVDKIYNPKKRVYYHENNELLEYLKQIKYKYFDWFRISQKLNKFIVNLFNSRKTELKNENYYFVETFHGKNFSGDPKIIALKIKQKYPESKIFVSSINSLVDSQIREFGLEPIRLNSSYYKYAFNTSKYAFINGNLIDKLKPTTEQTIFQFWHGMPLKKMVAQLENKKEARKQKKLFVPRMKKWDYLISNSELKTGILKESFDLNKNKKLKIIKTNMPIYDYLMENKNNLKMIEKIKQKYFLSKSKKIILYTPTWRKEKKKLISELDFVYLMDILGEDYHLIIKLHPLENYLVKKYLKIHNNISIFYNEFTDVNELFLISDILITDFSSAMFDYLILNRKLIIHQEDKEEYEKSIGCNFNVKDYLDIKIQKYNEETLADEIKNPNILDYEKIKKYIFDDDSSNSFKTIMDYIK